MTVAMPLVAPPPVTDAPVLTIEGLKVAYPTRRGVVHAVDGLSLGVGSGEVLGLVGESGSGKSTVARSILRLLRPPARIDGGRIMLGGLDLLTLDERSLRAIRWREVALVPQGSMSSLNPVMRVGDQIADAITAHEPNSDGAALQRRVEALLESVRLDRAVANRYPHELSGGMRQRACIAMATALDPRLLIADEPTSALDVVVQRAVVETLLAATRRLGASLILIGHDLALQAQVVDRLAVMRRGRLVEVGLVRAIFHEPVHPYTQSLLRAVPSLRRRAGPSHQSWPDRSDARPGRCFLGAACPQDQAAPSEAAPLLHDVGRGHLVACPLGERSPDGQPPIAHG